MPQQIEFKAHECVEKKDSEARATDLSARLNSPPCKLRCSISLRVGNDLFF
jgi:hypothetical protein